MTTSSASRALLLCAALVTAASVATACTSSDDDSSDATSTPSRATDPEWSVPSLPPSSVVDDSDVLQYVRVLQELTQAARAERCGTAWDLVDPEQVGGDRERFCDLYLPGLTDLDLRDGVLTFEDNGGSGDPAEISADFVRDESSSITLRTDDQGRIRVSRLSVLS
ncbi:hypothetical protein ACHAAC_17445 [Aeromicrobium sp. CF4.19]|uniref:hypothetical protein n=1 Tax=Aeromicrobium sp. CF4.19 TaxID=3373082 RepID=UPI003EE50B93